MSLNGLRGAAVGVMATALVLWSAGESADTVWLTLHRAALVGLVPAGLAAMARQRSPADLAQRTLADEVDAQLLDWRERRSNALDDARWQDGEARLLALVEASDHVDREAIGRVLLLNEAVPWREARPIRVPRALRGALDARARPSLLRLAAATPRRLVVGLTGLVWGVSTFAEGVVSALVAMQGPPSALAGFFLGSAVFAATFGPDAPARPAAASPTPATAALIAACGAVDAYNEAPDPTEPYELDRERELRRRVILATVALLPRG